MELIAIQAHVEDVEGSHRRPAVLVGKGDRDQAVRLHLGGQGDELVPGLRNLVAVRREDALPVDDDPRVVIDRHEVLFAVGAGRGGLHGVREMAADLGPDVTDVGREALSCEELHAVAGEPGEDVVRRALEIRADRILEFPVVGGVDRGGHADLRSTGVDQAGVSGLRIRIRLVRSDRDGAADCGL